MTDFLLEIDRQLLLLLNSYHTPLLDAVMIFITGRFTWVPFYVLLACLLVRRCGWRRGLVYLVGVALVITLADQVCASAIRPYVARLRPGSPDNPLSALVVSPIRCPRSFSFPSCHAANTFALAAYLTLIFRHRGVTIGMFAWATIVSLSRPYLGVHYPGDLLVGATIGSAIAVAVWWCATRAIEGVSALAPRKQATN